jgi:hypothetical protein
MNKVTAFPSLPRTASILYLFLGMVIKSLSSILKNMIWTINDIVLMKSTDFVGKVHVHDFTFISEDLLKY